MYQFEIQSELIKQLIDTFESDINNAFIKEKVKPRDRKHLINYLKAVKGIEVAGLDNRLYPQLGTTLINYLEQQGKDYSAIFLKTRANEDFRRDILEGDQITLMISSFELALVYAGFVQKEDWEAAYGVKLDEVGDLDMFNYTKHFPQN